MSEDHPEEVFQDYREILAQLSKDWMEAEMDHHVSKEGSNAFWKIANHYFPKLYKVKEQQGSNKNHRFHK